MSTVQNSVYFSICDFGHVSNLLINSNGDTTASSCAILLNSVQIADRREV